MCLGLITWHWKLITVTSPSQRSLIASFLLHSPTFSSSEQWTELPNRKPGNDSGSKLNIEIHESPVSSGIPRELPWSPQVTSPRTEWLPSRSASPLKGFIPTTPHSRTIFLTYIVLKKKTLNYILTKAGICLICAFAKKDLFWKTYPPAQVIQNKICSLAQIACHHVTILISWFCSTNAVILESFGHSSASLQLFVQL